MRNRWILAGGLLLALVGGLQARPFWGEDWASKRQQTPHFESRVMRAMVVVQKAHPGVGAGVARHLLEDLGDEPLQALLDVHADVLARYPDFDQQMGQWLQEGRQKRLALGQRFPGLRSFILERLAARKGTLAPGSQHPGLLANVALTASRFVDEHCPDFPERWQKRPNGQGMLAFWLLNYPEQLPSLIQTVQQAHGSQLRQAALELLARREEQMKQNPELFAQNTQAFLEKFPGLAEGRGEILMQRRQALLAKYPELPQLVRDSLQKRHPDLIQKGRDCVDQHYPGLREEWRSALAAQLAE